jgi:hypothetical protein
MPRLSGMTCKLGNGRRGAGRTRDKGSVWLMATSLSYPGAVDPLQLDELLPDGPQFNP